MFSLVVSSALRLHKTHFTVTSLLCFSLAIFGSVSDCFQELCAICRGGLVAMAAAGVLSAAGAAKMEVFTCAITGSSSIVSGAKKASFFVGGKTMNLVVARNNNAPGTAIVRRRRSLGVVKALDGNSTTTTAAAEAPISPSVDEEVEEVPIEKRFPAFPTALDINKIMEILPHRFPFLLVDRVIEYKPGVSAVAIKNVTINDNFFPGHFPQRPIMPGVLMVEAMAQVGGIVMLQPEVGGVKDTFFFAGVDKVRFRKPVIAGDTLVMKMKLTKLNKRFGVVKMEGQAYVGGELVCDGEFMMAMGKAE